jgi:hypothetical protein
MPGFDGVSDLLPNTAVVGGVTGTSGTYTPTLTNVNGGSSLVPQVSLYLRVLDMVFVTSYLKVNTSGAITFKTGISLPIASNFGVVTDCSGLCGYGAANHPAGFVQADAVNKRAELWQVFNATVTAATVYYSFMYRVL